MYQIDEFECVSVPGPESLKSKRGHGGICPFYRNQFKEGISVIETDTSGVMWIKLSKRKI
jgi:hypothetical protein